MFFPLWEPRLARHTLTTYFTNWVRLLLAAGLFASVPFVVPLFQIALTAGGYPMQGPVEIASEYWMLSLGSLVFSWLTLEMQGYALRKLESMPLEYPEFQGRLATLARRAGLPYTPAIVVIREVPAINAGATHSLLFGRKVLVLGPILDLLDLEQENAVFGHEIAHIKHGDIFALVLLHAGSRALSLQKWLLLGTVLYMAVQGNRHSLIAAGVLWGIVVVIHAAYRLLEMAHSRGREYLADVGTVVLNGWDSRETLIRSLIKIGAAQSGWSAFRLLRRSRGEIFMPHPPIRERAEALRVRIDLED